MLYRPIVLKTMLCRLIAKLHKLVRYQKGDNFGRDCVSFVKWWAGTNFICVYRVLVYCMFDSTYDVLHTSRHPGVTGSH